MERSGGEGRLSAVLDRIAPGTQLREGLDYIIAARTGALIVMGDETNVARICNGGFDLRTPFTPQRLFELAKMDGAIVLDESCRTILRANVHLVPDWRLPSAETGMRHQSAERVSRQTTALVISVSARRDMVSLYRGGEKYTLEPLEVLLAKANQGLQTLQRYRTRLDEVSGRLTNLEFTDLVTLDDVVAVVQRAEMMTRVSRDVSRSIVILGTEGRLVRLQADELMAGIEDDYVMLLRDYATDRAPKRVAAVRQSLASAPPDRVRDDLAIVGVLGHSGPASLLESHVRPRGYRVLHRIPKLPASVMNRLVDRFGTLQELMLASVAQLDDVEGVGERRARAVIEGLRRLKQTSAL